MFIIGGGVNGAGVARDAAGRGLKVGLCERDDLAMHTSSASTKLIHGGLRYLEHYAFRLVRESLIEREVLLNAAPHIIWPLRFVLPHHQGLRPAWLLRLGLFIYDHLGGRKTLPPTQRRDLNATPFRNQLKPSYRVGFEYSDCWVEDARLVALNAQDARQRGADISTRTECVKLLRENDFWTVTLKAQDGSERTVFARALINAAGPWADAIDATAGARTNRASVKLVKGSHIVVRRRFETEHAFILQSTDGRIVFVIPYERAFMLIGTTDVVVDTQAEGGEITEAEIEYLCENASEYLAEPVTTDDVVWTYAGVRALFDDQTEEASKITRDYVLNLDTDGAPRLSIYGGKLTTYRKLAEHALEKLSAVVAIDQRAWTHAVPLPGGDIPGGDFVRFSSALSAEFSWAPQTLVHRLARAYGTLARQVLAGANNIDDLGVHFGAGLYEREIEYLIAHEFARTADDVLWRRSKLALHMSPTERASVDRWFSSTTGSEAVAQAQEREHASMTR
ncbi:MAG: glycerol-3-phosphate dehydrogenase [Maricaulaceae bacterium]